MKTPMPAVFCGHGNPMNALADNAYTRGWKVIGNAMPRPRAVLAISAHWYLPSVRVTANASPPTIHDFGGFPPELYQADYPAPGDPALADRVRKLLAPIAVDPDTEWGLDHGTWSVLLHMYPEADVPVVQLSVDRSLRPETHYDIGTRLGPLRDEGVLIFGSGNLVHNLRLYAWGKESAAPFDWALRFEQKARGLMQADDDRSLIEYEKLGADANLAVPTPEHYLPLLYILSLRRPGEPVDFPVEGFDGGSVSMLAVRVGAQDSWTILTDPKKGGGLR